jgi:hypothetical protein
MLLMDLTCCPCWCQAVLLLLLLVVVVVVEVVQDLLLLLLPFLKLLLLLLLSPLLLLLLPSVLVAPGWLEVTWRPPPSCSSALSSRAHSQEISSVEAPPLGRPVSSQ